MVRHPASLVCPTAGGLPLAEARRRGHRDGSAGRDLAALVLAHHERHDGKGYPRGLQGDELPLEVSVIAVADTYDAMTSDRPYRKGMAWEQVRSELLRCRGTQWRELAVDAFIAMIEDERREIAARRPVAVPTSARLSER